MTTKAVDIIICKNVLSSDKQYCRINETNSSISLSIFAHYFSTFIIQIS